MRFLPCVATEPALLQKYLPIQFEILNRLLDPFHVPSACSLCVQCKIDEAVASVLRPKDPVRMLLGARGCQAYVHSGHINRNAKQLLLVMMMVMLLLAIANALKTKTEEAGNTFDGFNFHKAFRPRLILQRNGALVMCIQFDVHAHRNFIVIHIGVFARCYEWVPGWM